VSRLVARWDDAEADLIAAENLFLDRTKQRRRAEFEDIKTKLGMCTSDGRFDVVQNALRGQWTMTCERGKARASITLAPTMPPRVQMMQVVPIEASSDQPPRAACTQ
jgi:hypothetical protein